MEHARAALGGAGTPGEVVDPHHEFWFVVADDTPVYASDGTSTIGTVRAGRRYRALGLRGEWTAVAGPGGAPGFVATAAVRAVPDPERAVDPPPPPPPPPPPERAEYVATHLVPAAGLDAWAAPDPGAAPVARLDPGLDVMLLEHDPTGWGRVRCSNGWECWTDARRLADGPR